MKVLFASCRGCDWLASTTWQGLREVVGPHNLFDAEAGDRSLQNVRGHSEQLMGAEAGFDLLVLNAAFLRDHGWDWPLGHLGIESRGVPGGRLLPTAKIVYVEGWDSAWDVNTHPAFHPDLVLRREIYPGYRYPYDARPLLFALPASSFETDDHHRPLDVCCLLNNKSIGVRWDCCNIVSALPSSVKRVVTPQTETGAFVYGDYQNYLRASKLCICPPGAGSDCLRQWEAIALGSIPVFVGHPPRLSDPWFSSDDEIVWCQSAAELPHTIGRLLQTDLQARRQKLQAHALAEHTTKQRVLKMFRHLGVYL